MCWRTHLVKRISWKMTFFTWLLWPAIFRFNILLSTWHVGYVHFIFSPLFSKAKYSDKDVWSNVNPEHGACFISEYFFCTWNHKVSHNVLINFSFYTFLTLITPSWLTGCVLKTCFVVVLASVTMSIHQIYLFFLPCEQHAWYFRGTLSFPERKCVSY